MQITAYDEDGDRLKRLCRAAARLPEAVLARLTSLHDHKGILEVDFSSRPTQEDLKACAAAWRAENECSYKYREMDFDDEGILHERSW